VLCITLTRSTSTLLDRVNRHPASSAHLHPLNLAQHSLLHHCAVSTEESYISTSQPSRYLYSASYLLISKHPTLLYQLHMSNNTNAANSVWPTDGQFYLQRGEWVRASNASISSTYRQQQQRVFGQPLFPSQFVLGDVLCFEPLPRRTLC
jgi:hypothetical protein